jgi:hypothetical protein
MKKAMAKKVLGSSVVVLTGLLASCNPTSPVIPIAAPQNILTIPDDKNVTVIWDAVDDARVTGYNVYQDGQKVNSDLIAASSRVTTQAANPLRRLQFVVSNVSLANLAKFTVRAVGSGTEGTTSPESPARPVVCNRYLVKGTDMGMQSQNVSLTRAAATLSSATVRVNGTNIPFTSSIFQGNLPSGVAVGSNLELLTADGDCLVYARDTLPEKPVVTAPNAGVNVSNSAVLPVSWTSATNPDRFVVSATWLEGAGGTGWRSADLAPTARSFDIPAGTLPSDKSVKIRVYAYNDGTETFIGAFETGSRMAIRHGDEAGKDITTNPPAAATLPGVSWGDPHLITFDQSGVEFQSVGEFDLGFSSDSQFRVQARQQPWGSSTFVSVNTAIATRMNGKKVGFYVTPSGGTPLRLDDAGIRTVVPSGGLDLGSGFTITQSGTTYTLRFPTGDRIEVTVGLYINAYLYPAASRTGTMKGLLGNMDGNTTNDTFLRDGSALSPFNASTFYGQYANSWRIPSLADSLFVYDGSEAFGGFDDTDFPSNAPAIPEATQAAAQATCEAAGVAINNIPECTMDVAVTGDNGFATNAATVPNPVGETIIPKPDLIISAVRLSLGDVCRPYNAFVNGSVVVKNIGTATAAARSDVGVVQLVDARDELLGAGYRGNGMGIPEIPAGGSATVNISLFYPISSPEDTEGLRSYVARADFGNWYNESNESNNRFADTAQIDVPKGHCKNKVGLIHGANNSAATAYKTGLENKGMRVTLLPLSSLNPNSTATLMDYDLLAIDSKTGSLNVWEGEKGMPEAIGNAGRPILGLGEGGYAFLGKSSSPIGWANGWHGSGATTFALPSPVHASDNNPFPVTNTAGSVEVASAGMDYVAINLPPTIATNLKLMARQSGQPNHYLSVLNTTPTSTTGASEAIWGFDGMPTYTENGWNALANLGWFMLP